MDELEAILETGGAAAVEIAASALAERGGKTAPCPNCEHPLIGPYCAICGQPVNTHRRSLGHLVQEFVKDVVSFDSRILRTARALVVQPGELPLAFHQGRTQRYVPPVRLYLFVSLLFFLFLSGTGIALIQFTMQTESFRLVREKDGTVVKIENGQRKVLSGFKADANGNVRIDSEDTGPIPIPKLKADGSLTNNVTTRTVFFQRIGSVHNNLSPELKSEIANVGKDLAKKTKDYEGSWMLRAGYATLVKLETDPAALDEPLLRWIPRILFLLLPLFAVVLAAFYWRQRKEFFYVDHLVFSFGMHTFGFVALIAAAIAAQFVAGGWVVLFLTVAIGTYFLLALKRFYGQGWGITILKSVGIAIIYNLFLLTPALSGAIVAGVVGV